MFVERRNNVCATWSVFGIDIFDVFEVTNKSDSSKKYEDLKKGFAVKIIFPFFKNHKILGWLSFFVFVERKPEFASTPLNLL